MARERFRIGCIRIRGLTTHRDTAISVPPGSLALIGENGAGKTSILEAIHIALTGKPLRASRAGEVVSLGAPSATVDLLLQGDRGTQAHLRVSIPRNRNASYLLRVNGKIVASTATGYKAELARLLGFRSHRELEKLLEVVGIVRQGGLQSIALKMVRPRDFREMLEEAIGIPEYRDAVDRLESVDLAADLEEDVGSWTIPRGGITSRAKPSSKYVRLKRLMAELSEKASEARRTIADAEEALKAINGEIAELEDRIARLTLEAEPLRDSPGLVKALAETIAKLEEEVERLEREIRRLEGELDHVNGQLEALAEAERLSSLEEEAREARDLKAKVETLEGTVALLEELIRHIEAASTLPKVEEDLKRIESQLAEVDEEIEELNNRIAEVKSKLELAEDKEKRVRELVERASRLLGRTLQDPHRALEELVSEADRLDGEKEKLLDKASSLEAEASSLEREAAEAERALEILKSSSRPECPVCGRPLDREHRSRVERLLYEKAAGKARASKLRREASTLRAKAKRLESKARTLRDAAAKLEDALRDYDPDMLPRLRGELERLSSMLEEAKGRRERLEKEWSRLAGRLGELRKAARDAERLARRLSLPRVPGLEEARGMHAQARRELARARARLGELADKLSAATGARSLDEAIARVLDAALEARRIPVLREKAASLSRQIGEKRGMLEEKLGELGEARERLREVERMAARLRRIEEELEELRRSLEEARERRARIESQAEQARRTLEESKRRIEAYSKVRRRMEAAMVAGRILSEIQEALARQAVVALQNSMNAVLSRFNLDYVSVDLRMEGDGIVVEAYSRSRAAGVPVNLLSGGEKSALALAYVLGLQRILSAGIGFLALDEPTSDLDQERRLVLLDVLGSAVGEESVDQLIVVTHHQEIIDKVDRVCVVEKRDGVSRLVDPEGGPCPRC